VLRVSPWVTSVLRKQAGLALIRPSPAAKAHRVSIRHHLPCFGPDETAFCSLKMHEDSGATVECGLLGNLFLVVALLLHCPGPRYLACRGEAEQRRMGAGMAKSHYRVSCHAMTRREPAHSGQRCRMSS